MKKLGNKLKRLIAACMAFAVVCVGGACSPSAALPEYEPAEFTVFGYWAPYEISEQSFKLYKDCGMNTLMMVNHAGERTSEEQFYLGSERTIKSLRTCRATGLAAMLNYNDWIAESVHKNHYSQTPFSQYDLYGEYKDIIRGVHICDEPKREHLEKYFLKELADDFRETYPNSTYFVNLHATYGTHATGYTTYDDYLAAYFEGVNECFESDKFVSVDFYPYRAAGEIQFDWLVCYDKIARAAKLNNARFGCYIQSSQGAEFRPVINRGEIFQQVNVALCYGVRTFGYYCYANPASGEQTMYDSCILGADGQPSEIYDYVKAANSWLDFVSDAFGAYEWTESFGVHGGNDEGGALDFISSEIPAGKKLTAASADGNMLVGCFNGERGEAYMLAGFTDPMYGEKTSATLTFEGCSQVAVYTVADGRNRAETVKTKNGKLAITLDSGGGAFVVPIK